MSPEFTDNLTEIVNTCLYVAGLCVGAAALTAVERFLDDECDVRHKFHENLNVYVGERKAAASNDVKKLMSLTPQGIQYDLIFKDLESKIIFLHEVNEESGDLLKNYLIANHLWREGEEYADYLNSPDYQQMNKIRQQTRIESYPWAMRWMPRLLG